MRILVVDDELVSRTKMKTIISRFGDVKTAENGTEAVNHFRKAIENGCPYQLVTLDINMPDITGTEVLYRFREMERQNQTNNGKAAIIIMVTAQSDKDNVMTCLQGGCNDYISKPFNYDIVRTKLLRFGLIARSSEAPETPKKKKSAQPESLYADICARLKSGEYSLPIMPQTSIKVRELIRNNADVSQMAELLKQDVGMASQLLKSANSVHNRGYEKVQSIEQAINRVGVTVTAQIVYSINNQRLHMVTNRQYSDIVHNLWKHSLACACAADILSQATEQKNQSLDPFTAGLFHDIGALALIQIIADIEQNGKFSEKIEQTSLIETVRAYHTVFGGKLLEKWGLGADYIRIALYHHQLNFADSVTPELELIHSANLLVKSMGYQMEGPAEEVQMNITPWMSKFNIASHQLSSLIHQIRARVDETIAQMS